MESNTHQQETKKDKYLLLAMITKNPERVKKIVPNTGNRDTQLWLCTCIYCEFWRRGVGLGVGGGKGVPNKGKIVVGKKRGEEGWVEGFWEFEKIIIKGFWVYGLREYGVNKYNKNKRK